MLPKAVRKKEKSDTRLLFKRNVSLADMNKEHGPPPKNVLQSTNLFSRNKKEIALERRSTSVDDLISVTLENNL